MKNVNIDATQCFDAFLFPKDLQIYLFLFWKKSWTAPKAITVVYNRSYSLNALFHAPTVNTTTTKILFYIT